MQFPEILLFIYIYICIHFDIHIKNVYWTDLLLQIDLDVIFKVSRSKARFHIWNFRYVKKHLRPKWWSVAMVYFLSKN